MTWRRLSTSCVSLLHGLPLQQSHPHRQPPRTGQLSPRVEVGRRAQVVEEGQVLIHRLDAEGSGVGRTVHLHWVAVDLDHS